MTMHPMIRERIEAIATDGFAPLETRMRATATLADTASDRIGFWWWRTWGERFREDAEAQRRAYLSEIWP